MQKKALITGITGQDGSYLAELLLEKGYEVHGIVRRAAVESDVERFSRINHIKDKVVLHSGDIVNYQRIIEVVSVVKPDEIYHLAAQSFVQESFEDPSTTVMMNIQGTLNILNAVKNFSPKSRLYFAASSEMFGKVREMPQTENTPFYPRSPYGISKLTGFELARNYREAYGLFACSGILFNHECISEHAPIIVRNKMTKVISIKRIRDIRRPREKGTNVQQWIIDDIEVWDGDNFVDLKFITSTRRKKDEDNFKCKIMNTRKGIVETTNHHTMILDNGNKVKAISVSAGDKLLHKDFPIADEIAILSKEEALFLGILVGDGYISENGRAQITNNDPKIINLIRKLWKEIGLGGITIRDYKTEYGRATQIKLLGNSRYLHMIKNEIYTYDGFKKIPDRIINASKEIKLAFLIGYNMTDGLKSNPCVYEFKNFKTNSSLLAHGLLFLISHTTQQKFNITFEEDEKYYGYYSINLLSPTDNSKKEDEVNDLIYVGLGQKAIYEKTGISRTFIRKIQQGGHAEVVHHLARPKEEVKKIVYHAQQPSWVFDIETGSGKFMAGVGNIVVANSPRRGYEFVTRKITRTAAKISRGEENVLLLGNLNAKRDWGFAKDYVEAMWHILQQSKPDDFVIATGETHSVLEFITSVFSKANINNFEIVDLHELPVREADERVAQLREQKDKVFVVQYPKFYRPAEVDLLIGNADKARTILGWKPKVSFNELVSLMTEHDLKG